MPIRMKTRSAADSKALFETMPIPRAVATLAVPMVISQMVVLVYNMADTWFIGQTGDPAQVAALTVTYPVFMLLNAVSNLFAVGGGSLVSRQLGRGDLERAGRTATATIWMAAGSAVCFALVMAVVGGPMLGLLGARGDVARFAWYYLVFACMVGAPFTILNLVMAAIVRAEGKSSIASIGMCLGVAVNMVLAPLLIFVAGLQVAGAALATALSNAVGLAFLLAYVVRHRADAMVRMSVLPKPIPGADVRAIVAVGLPAALVIILSSVSNSAMVRFLSSQPTEVLSGMGVMQRLETIPFQLIMGISDGVIPLVAYTFVSGDHRRMRAAIRTTLGVGFVSSVACLLIYQLFADGLVGLFIDEPTVVIYGARFLRLRSLALPSIVIEFMLIAVFQATGSTKPAMVLSLLRKGTIDLPLMALANLIWPLYGLMLVQPLMETVGALVAGAFYRAIDRMLDRLGTDHIDLLLLHQQFGDYLGAWKDMERAVDAGKVRSIGLSNFESDRLEQVIDAARILPSVLQVECHPYYQQNKLKTRLAPYGIALEAWYPLGHGDAGLLSEPVILRLAERYGKTPAQIILRWHVQEGTIVFPRSTNPEHMRQNIDILDFSLTEQDMEAIRLLDKGQRFFTMTLEEQEAHLSQFKPAD